MKYNIKDKEFWEGFKNGEFVINCETKEEFRILLSECEKKGLIWNSGLPATKKTEVWDDYRQYICVESYTNKLMYSDTRWFREHDKEIIKFKDIKIKTYTLNEVFDFEDNTKFIVHEIGKVVEVKTINGQKQLIDNESKWTYYLNPSVFNATYKLIEEWEEVDFMKAIKSYDLLNTIKCSCNKKWYVFEYGDSEITSLSDDILFMDMVFNGKWFIKT